MVIDTSAVLAILLDERDATRYAEAIEQADSCHMSAANYLEAAMIVDTRGDSVASREFDLFFRRSDFLIEPVTFEHAQTARQAYRDFGKGRHPAGLNFGDCLAYALAKSLDEPLLFKGSDFSRTDIEAAV
ncbi:MAG: ribonuclease [Bryobacterales bacterium]|nr:ribonuclease [Bryobacterales bacterium]